MNEIKEIFYNIFWQNRACQNLFLLSKEELLDTKTITIEGVSKSVSFPRIILSNIDDKRSFEHETIKFRNDSLGIRAERSLNAKLERYTPLVTNFLEGKFGKSLTKIITDIEKDPNQLIQRLASVILSDTTSQEKEIIGLLSEYGLIGRHIGSFDELNRFIQKEAIDKNLKNFLSEKNIWDVLEFLKGLKDLYTNEAYRSLYNSNQVLINSLFDIDNFSSRQQLFSILFDSGIIIPSKEDAFVECVNCEPGTYKGTIQLKLNPVKLENLKCPVCNNKLTYYVPYELHPEIYDIVKKQDGLLLDALLYLLNERKIKYVNNENKLNDIEIDCQYQHNGLTHIVECKMYKLNTTPERLKSKLKKHFTKLLADIERLEQAESLDLEKTQAILLVNINDNGLLRETEEELKSTLPDNLSQRAKIVNVNEFF